MKKTTKKLLLCTALTAVTAISGKSQAQDAPEGALVLDPVVITGTRIAQPASELAGNTAVLEADEITLTSHDNPAELLNRLPGVYIHSNDGQEHQIGRAHV